MFNKLEFYINNISYAYNKYFRVILMRLLISNKLFFHLGGLIIIIILLYDY